MAKQEMNNVKNIRLNLGLSQSFVAEELGMKRAQLYQLECKSKNTPQAKTVLRIREFYKKYGVEVTAKDFMTG